MNSFMARFHPAILGQTIRPQRSKGHKLLATKNHPKTPMVNEVSKALANSYRSKWFFAELKGLEVYGPKWVEMAFPEVLQLFFIFVWEALI